MIYPVVLDEKELARACSVGENRQAESVRKGDVDAHGFDGDGLAIHVMGACGELAVAKVLELDWSAPVNTYKSGGDVGELQVRTSDKFLKSKGLPALRPKCSRLIIRPGDDSKAMFVLVWRLGPNQYEVAGYMKGAEAKQAQWWVANPSNGRPPAYFVPHIELMDVKRLLRLFSVQADCPEREQELRRPT
jgi:hypothetical protein